MTALKERDTLKVLDHIRTSAEQTKVQRTRHVEAIEVGKVVRQGDIYLHRVEDTHPRGARCEAKLAMGETQGSRHYAEAPAVAYSGTTVPSWCADTTFLGPLVESPERFTVTHPEHAHVSLPPGCYQVTHQMDARTLQRVKD